MFSINEFGEKEKLDISTLVEPDDFTYPSMCFPKPEKPKLNVCKFESNELTRLAYAMLYQNQPVDSRVIVAFMHKVMTQFPTARLSSDWDSFGIRLGKGGEEVKVLDLVDVKMLDTPVLTLTAASETDVKDSTDLGMFYHCSTYLRLVEAHNTGKDAYTQRIGTKMAEQGTGAPFNLGIKKSNTQYGNWSNLATNKDYVMLMSILDMYLAKFKNHEMAKLRMSSIVCRHFGYTGYQDMRHVGRLLSVDTKTALSYIYSESVAKEVRRMLKPNEEVEKEDSYAPYLVKMGLIPRSPYSSASNPHFSCWVHTIGCLVGSNRSKNGKAMTDIGTAPIFYQAAMIAYYCKPGEAPQMRFLKEKQATEYDAAKKAGKLDVASPLKSGKMSEDEWVKKHDMRNSLNILGLYSNLGTWPKRPTKWARAVCEKLPTDGPNSGERIGKLPLSSFHISHGALMLV